MSLCLLYALTGVAALFWDYIFINILILLLLIVTIPSFVLTGYTDTRLVVLFWDFTSVIVLISVSYCSSKKGTFWKLFFLVISIQARAFFNLL